jgi:hypothetical protein
MIHRRCHACPAGINLRLACSPCQVKHPVAPFRYLIP